MTARTAAQKAQDVLDELSARLATMPQAEVQAHADRCQQTLDEYASILKPSTLDTRMATRVRRELDLATGALAHFAPQAGAVPDGGESLSETLRAFALTGAGGQQDSKGRDVIELSQHTSLQRLAAQSTTDAAGGFTIPDEVGELTKLLALTSPLFDYITIQRRESGRTVNMPTSDGTTVQAQEIAENTESADASNLVFKEIEMSFGNFATDVLVLSRELLEDSEADMEREMIEVLMSWMGRGLADALTDGTGSTSIQGYTESTAFTSAFTAAGAAVVTLDELRDLRNSVDERYQRGAAYSFNWGSKAILEKVSVGNRSIIAENPENPLVGFIRSGVGGGTNEDILAPYFINPKLPTMATGTESIVYGDFSKVRMFQTGPWELLRFTDSPYARKRQVGFMMQARRAGKLVTAGVPIRHITQG